jgi:ZIP family zinc transporter
VIGVVFFDLIPEAIALAGPAIGANGVLAIVAAGFLAYMVLHRSARTRARGGAESEDLRFRGALGAGSLAVHSFLDGFVIGLGFQVSNSVGLIVSVAVLVHDFSDGVNTVGIVLGKKGGNRNALLWLLVDAVAPVLGAASTIVLSFRPETLGFLLALCGGFFIYLSASDLVPESYHDHPTALTTLMTVLGMLTLFIVARLAQI